MKFMAGISVGLGIAHMIAFRGGAGWTMVVAGFVALYIALIREGRG